MMVTLFAHLKSLGISLTANDNISAHLTDADRERIEQDVASAFGLLLRALLIDGQSDHNTRDTPKRVAKMFVREVFKGRYFPAPDITDFPNAKNLDEIYTVGPIEVRSACSHHFVPIVGHAWVAIKPSDRVIGLSKFNRLTDWVMSRPQIQEEATVMLADAIEEMIKPEGLAVVIKAQHLCMSWRGVKDSGTTMTTSIMRGIFRDKPASRAEVMALLSAQQTP
jgi:GTP cyclohydrolase I